MLPACQEYNVKNIRSSEIQIQDAVYGSVSHEISETTIYHYPFGRIDSSFQCPILIRPIAFNERFYRFVLQSARDGQLVFRKLHSVVVENTKSSNISMSRFVSGRTAATGNFGRSETSSRVPNTVIRGEFFFVFFLRRMSTTRN